MIDYWMPFRIWLNIESSLCSETCTDTSVTQVEQYINDMCGLVRQHKNICSDGIIEFLGNPHDDDEYALYKVVNEKLFYMFLFRWS